MKTITVILGMHRSGTSAFTACLSSLGLKLGTFEDVPDIDNPKGYFEHLAIREFNNRLLAFIGVSWDNWGFYAPEEDFHHKKYSRWIEDAGELLGREFGDEGDWIIKEPRISFLLSFWKLVFDRYNWTTKYILILRHPSQVASSQVLRALRRPDLFQIIHDRESACALWTVTIAGILQTSFQPSVLVINNGEFLAEPVKALRKCADFLGIRVDDSKIIANTSEILDPTLNRSSTELPDQIGSWEQIAIYLYVCLQPGNEHRELSSAELASIFDEQIEFKRLLPFLGATRRSLYANMAWANARIQTITAKPLDLVANRTTEPNQLQIEAGQLLQSTFQTSRRDHEPNLEEALDAARAEFKLDLREALATSREEFRTANQQAQNAIREERGRAIGRARQSFRRRNEYLDALFRHLGDEYLKQKPKPSILSTLLQLWILGQSEEFDVDWYQSRYPDVALTGKHPITHYYENGARLLRNPSPQFDTKYYVETYPQVRKSGLNPLIHYAMHGKSEGLNPLPPESKEEKSADQRIESWNNGEFVDAIAQEYKGKSNQYNEIKVSIVLPAHNRADVIGDAIKSVQLQTHSNWELLVVDDGSNDTTALQVEILAESDSRIKLYRNSHGGVSKARNTALHAAKGQIIAYLDSDNNWQSEYLRTMVVFMLSRGFDCAYSGLAYLDIYGEVTKFSGREFDWNDCLEGNFVDLNVYCHMKNFDGEVIEFDESLRRTVDWDVILRQTKGREVGYAPFVGCAYAHTDRADRITNKEALTYRKIVQIKNQATPPRPAAEIAALLKLSIAVKISAPRSKKDEWGDFHFAESLCGAIEKLGHTTRIDFLEEWGAMANSRDDVAIILRGLSQHRVTGGKINVMWNISHPDQVGYSEYDEYHLVYVASLSYAEFLKGVVKKPVKPLLQATDVDRFHPQQKESGAGGAEVLFVGNSRNQYRSIVKWAVDEDLPIEIHGTRWSQFVPSKFVKSENVKNAELGALYASSRHVLNDHWESMREFGLLSNRLFDATSSGAHVISDPVPSIDLVFGSAVSQVSTPAELREATRIVIDEELRLQTANAITARHSFDMRAREIVDDVFRLLNLPPQHAVSVSGAQNYNLAVLKRAPVKVALVVRHTVNGPQSSYYLRLLAPLTAEVLAGGVNLRTFSMESCAEALSSDVVIVQRTAFDTVEQAEQFLAHLKKRNIKLIVDNDDAFTHMDQEHAEYAIYRDRSAGLDLLLRHADAAWYSSAILRDLYKDASSNSLVMENMLDPRIWRDYRRPRSPILQGKIMRAVYMGTATHDADFEQVLPALDALHTERPGSFSLTIVGAVRKPPERPWLNVKHPPRDCTQYPRFVRWLRDANAFDVGLAPLVDNVFNSGKSDLKLLDYAALGILPIVSDTPSYRGTVENCGIGVKSGNTTEEWLASLLHTLENPDQAREMANAAWNYVWSNRHVSIVAEQQLASLRGMA